MKKSPLVSVVIPAYNAEEYIAETVDSVIEQSYANIEIIVVDDGSTDSTKSILNRYVLDGKVRYFYQENAKQAAARNKGVQVSNGEFIAFLDADDIWLKNKLAAQIKLFNDPMVGMVYGNAVYWDGENQTRHSHESEFMRGWIFEKLLIYGNFIWASTVVVRKNVLEKVGVFENWVPIEDYHLWLRIARYYKADYSNEIVEKYRIHAGNVSGNKYLMMRREIEVICDIAEKLAIKWNLKFKALSRVNFEIAYSYVNDNCPERGMQQSFLAVLYNPIKFKNWKIVVKALLQFGAMKAMHVFSGKIR